MKAPVQRAAFVASVALASACNPSAFDPVDVERHGELTNDDAQAPHDGSRYDTYPLQVEAGWQIRVELRSDAFDTYLWLTAPERPWPFEDDDGLPGTDSAISVTARTGGTYRVIANSFEASGRGPYTLRIVAGPNAWGETSAAPAPH